MGTSNRPRTPGGVLLIPARAGSPLGERSPAEPAIGLFRPGSCRPTAPADHVPAGLASAESVRAGVLGLADRKNPTHGSACFASPRRRTAAHWNENGFDAHDSRLARGQLTCPDTPAYVLDQVIVKVCLIFQEEIIRPISRHRRQTKRISLVRFIRLDANLAVRR